jgi:DNA-binding NtrC family response regulator
VARKTTSATVSAGQLSAAQREFLRLVQQAALANPFSDERAAIETRIAGHFPGVARTERAERTLTEVRRRLVEVAPIRQAGLRAVTGDDRALVMTALLFDFFYRFRERFDALIREQIAAGQEPVPVPFADEALGWLAERGFTPELGRRYLALSYQLRRAFHFIDQGLVGRSRCMHTLRRDLWDNVFTHRLDLYDRFLRGRMEDFSTLLLGETGTGKGTAAAAIGRSGLIPFDAQRGRFVESFTSAFISLNLSQFPESLIESELFGHTKGAFTGAIEDHPGVFARCSPHGAILLDEIGELAIPIQIKLLQVLQERVFCPVGSHRPGRFQGRVIAATNRSLAEIRQQGLFRDDFYYRLCSDVIVVPPLRQRIAEDPGELDDLLAHTLARLLGKPSPELASLVRAAIAGQLGPGYAWPGNVRELEQCVRRVLLKRSYEGHRPPPAQRDLQAVLQEALRHGELDARGLLSGYCRLLHDRLGTLEAVARVTGLDRRTVKRYVAQGGRIIAAPES